MNIKRRIWSLPVISTIIFGLGVAASAAIASGALDSIRTTEQVDYPVLDAAKTITLGSSAALMIVLGYPGEIATDLGSRALWGGLSMIPFIYIVWQLFVGLGDSIKQQPVAAQGLVRTARLVTFASWGFYPVVFAAPFFGLTGGSVETTIQVGYTIADLIAKVGLGILIFLIAVRKSESETADGKAYAG